MQRRTVETIIYHDISAQTRGPWYRGGVPRSYVPPTVFASVGFALCLTVFGFFMTFVGSVLTGVAYKKPQPPFDTPFFTKDSEKNPLRTVGPVILGTGLVMLTISIILCCVAASLAKKQENERHAHQQAGQSNNVCNPPPSAYPHQQTSQSFYPTAYNYPSQSANHVPPESNYPPRHQDQHPPQPYTAYLTSHLPPSGNSYPYTEYPQSQSYQYNDYNKPSATQPIPDAPPPYDSAVKQ